MQPKSYSETIDWLFQRFPSYQNIGASAYKPGLENVLKLCEAFNNPQKKLKFVHVAGSNGKGSTCSILASFLTENGLKTGLFTSPHLVDFRERIRIDGETILEKDVVSFCEKILSLPLDFEPSFFEITFVMALVHFEHSKCDICVIETGLGGRLDATNIINPLLSIITTISLE
ncbi:MAG: bifunctional folylpolyglutamate synthase/dihydrofolate synthase, partial [Bacteroidota bacterium]